MDDSTGPIRSIDYIEMPGTALDRPEPPPRPEAPPQPTVAPAAPRAPAPARRPVESRAEVSPPRPRVGADISPSVRLGKGCYVSPTASIRGDVTIGEEVFVGPASSIRGDSGAPIQIGSLSNVQDGAVIHTLEGRALSINNKSYAVYIGERVSLAHQCLVHGPSAVFDGSFIGFGAVVLNSMVGRDCVVMHLAYVSNVEIPEGRMVPVGAVVDTPERARALPRVTSELKEFAAEVARANRQHASEYNGEEQGVR